MDLEHKIYVRYLHGGEALLPDLMRDLLSSQLSSWNEYSENYENLSRVKTRAVYYKESEVKVQWNPKRIASTGVQLGQRNRSSCFLCLDQLPAVQKGILYRDKYLVLCNPFPIFHEHFTIANIRHCPQLLENSIEEFILVARDVGPDFAVFYNGASCGASAPDHHHFQCCPQERFSTFQDVSPGASECMERARIFSVQDVGRGGAIIESGTLEDSIRTLSGFMQAMKRISGLNGEPMINVVCSYHDFWRIAVFPRKKHRPDVFYASDAERLMISPGAIDMSGTLITPIKEHFERITAEDILNIFTDVAYDIKFVQRAIDSM
jgi:hypothetical protein